MLTRLTEWIKEDFKLHLACLRVTGQNVCNVYLFIFLDLSSSSFGLESFYLGYKIIGLAIDHSRVTK